VFLNELFEYSLLFRDRFSSLKLIWGEIDSKAFSFRDSFPIQTLFLNLEGVTGDGFSSFEYSNLLNNHDLELLTPLVGYIELALFLH
jgi:hypothetical protein